MTPEELLRKGLNELGFQCSENQIHAFMTYLLELKKWNRAYNLTALKTDEDIIIKHFIDSALYLKAIFNESSQPACPARFAARRVGRFAVPGSQLKLCDAGTGAGFPGIPIKIIRPDLEVTLIEPSRKKTAFLRHIVRLLKLTGIHVINDRLETIGSNYKGAFDVIVSRAAFKAKDFLKKACPYVKNDGILVLSKGPKVDDELKGLEKQGVIGGTLKLALNMSTGAVRSQGERNLVILKCRQQGSHRVTAPLQSSN